MATVEVRDASGWRQVRQEMRYLPRCPKRKRIISSTLRSTLRLKNTHFLLSLGSIALREFLHVTFVNFSVLILQVKEHLGVIVMRLQPSSDAFAEILVEGAIVVEA